MLNLYLSGPMNGIKDKNKIAFEEATQVLRDNGYKVLSPWELDQKSLPSWAEYVRRDIHQMMLYCNAVAVLPGWKKSKGATLEVHIAKTLGWPVHSVNYWRKTCRISSKV